LSDSTTITTLANRSKIRRVNEKNSLQDKLEDELEELKKKVNYGHELKVIWLPSYDSKLSGEVKNNTIYIYESSEDEAIETLRHEFVDYIVSQAIEPYKLVINKLIQLLNETAYEKKEKVVETLVKLLDNSDSSKLKIGDIYD
jgi:hypothetical protein